MRCNARCSRHMALCKAEICLGKAITLPPDIQLIMACSGPDIWCNEPQAPYDPTPQAA